MKKIIACLLLLAFAANAFSQIAPLQHIAVLKAEDARRYGPPIETLFRHSNPDVRYRAVLAAGRIGDERAIDALGKLFESETGPEMHAMIAFALGEIESIKAADLVLTAIRGSKSAASAARLVEASGKIAAANIGDPKAAELRAAILSVLESEQRKGAKANRETVLLGLTAAQRAVPRDTKRIRPDETDRVVALFLTSHDARVRADAANTLARVRAKNASDVLRRIVASDVDPIARATAARALAAAEDKDAVNILIKAATLDADQRVRVTAVRSLGALRDTKAAGPLLTRGETLLAAYKRASKPGVSPDEQNEFIEIAAALGRLLPNTRNERAIDLFREFGKLDRGFSTDVYVARLRIAPGRGDGDNPELTHWRQYSTLAQVIGEFSALEPTTDEGKRMKTEAPGILRPLAVAYAEADPAKEADTIMAAPDVLRAFARFKTDDLSEVLRTALKNKDIFVRAAAAELLSEQPASKENFDALMEALQTAIHDDVMYNDAALAIIDALFKIDKEKSFDALLLGLASNDHLVRMRSIPLINNETFKNRQGLAGYLKVIDNDRLREVKPYTGKGTKMGSILNSDADYARALGRKNGSVRAVVTTQKGTFTIEFLPEDAPLTVDNFIKLARSGYFNGLEVHRVVSNFVMQDGDPRGDGNGGPGWSIRCEMNMVPYERGAVGMALSGKDTGGSQWFVTHSRQPHLDGGYTVFGRVNETGMKVVDRIVRGDKIMKIEIVERSSPPGTRRRR